MGVQSDPNLTNQNLSRKLSNPFLDAAVYPTVACNMTLSTTARTVSAGYSGSGAAQLAVAILMEIFGNWERVQPIYQRFMDCFVVKLPQNTNWTGDGGDLMAMALAIGGHPSQNHSFHENWPSIYTSSQNVAFSDAAMLAVG